MKIKLTSTLNLSLVLLGLSLVIVARYFLGRWSEILSIWRGFHSPRREFLSGIAIKSKDEINCQTDLQNLDSASSDLHFSSA